VNEILFYNNSNPSFSNIFDNSSITILFQEKLQDRQHKNYGISRTAGVLAAGCSTTPPAGNT
jgi:hypothetical protein